MTNKHAVVDQVQIIKSDISDIDGTIKEHIASLAYPMDSWLEDNLLQSVIYELIYDQDCIGYAGQIKETLHFYYIKKEYFRYAPAILEKIVAEKAVKRIFVITQDSLLSTLIAEWDYDKEKQACWFTDSLKVVEPVTQVSHCIFRTAAAEDAARIREVSGDFFDEASGGFACLEDRIAAGTIFLLEDRESLLGCGIVEKSQLSNGIVSIGMFVNREYRRKGAAKTILLHLKQWAYDNNLTPVAGCWYYNTLSRKSLESAGMIATSIGYEATLKGKEKLPLRTGNPPGELVEEDRA